MKNSQHIKNKGSCFINIENVSNYLYNFLIFVILTKLSTLFVKKLFRSNWSFMAEYKNQHIVPQNYLRGFSKDKETLYRYNIKNGEASLKSIKKTCSSSYYYGKEGLEQALGDELESKQAPILNKLIFSRKLEHLTIDETGYLLLFLTFQYWRTESARRLASKFIDTIMTENFRMFCQSNNNYSKEEIDEIKIHANPQASHAFMMKTALENSYVISDLSRILLINESKNHFISSDNPVVFYNYKMLKNQSTIGVTCSGLIIFCPLTENLLLLLVDQDLYDICADTPTTVIVNNEMDINSINKLQFFNCHENIFYSSESDLSYLKEIHLNIKDDITERKTILTKILSESSKEQDSEFIKITATDINYKIKLSFLKLNKRNNMKYKRLIRKYKKNGIGVVIKRHNF